jgi:hypothetical protein
MKTIAIALVLLLGTAAAASSIPSPTAPVKNDSGVVPPEGTLQGGDTIETAVVIPSVPYFTTGTTEGYTNDYDEACPWLGSISPDVVYAWTPDAPGYVDIHTCESAYDTKIYVYENEHTPGVPIACSDDNSDCPGPPYRSWIQGMRVIGGNTYYIVVDGYGGDYGEYLLTVEWVTGPQPCDVFCPGSAFDENEPDCYDGYEDNTNSGCQRFVFQYPGINTHICGASGNHDGNTVRDMDWFEIVLDQPTVIEYCVCADFPPRLWIMAAPDDCYDYYTHATDGGSPNEWLCMEHELWAGVWYFIVSTDGWIGVPCGSEYVASIFEEGYSPVEQLSWGVIKRMYR